MTKRPDKGALGAPRQRGPGGESPKPKGHAAAPTATSNRGPSHPASTSGRGTVQGDATGSQRASQGKSKPGGVKRPTAASQGLAAAGVAGKVPGAPPSKKPRPAVEPTQATALQQHNKQHNGPQPQPQQEQKPGPTQSAAADGTASAPPTKAAVSKGKGPGGVSSNWAAMREKIGATGEGAKLREAREKAAGKKPKTLGSNTGVGPHYSERVHKRECVCVCVCVCEREREREGERGRGRERLYVCACVRVRVRAHACARLCAWIV